MVERTMGPDVVVLEHDHARQVVPVRVDPADEHAVFLDEPEARRRLARARDDALVPVRARDVVELLRPAQPPARQSENNGIANRDAGIQGFGERAMVRIRG